MANKGMLTARYNRKSVEVNTEDKLNNNSIQKSKVNTSKRYDYNEPIRPDIVHTYIKPNRLRSIQCNEYTDTQRNKNRLVKYSNHYIEIPKDTYRIPSIELKQFAQLVRVSCNVLASLNGYVTYTDVRKHLLDNSFAILDNKLLQDVVRSFLQTRPHLIKKHEHNSVNHNKVTYGYESEPIRPKTWEQKQYWAKIMGICEL